MASITRPAKTLGNTSYAAEVAGGQTKIKSAEIDADLDTIYAEFNGQIQNENIKAGAAIEYSKLDLVNSITNADIAAAAAIAGSKLAVGAGVNATVAAAGTSGLTFTTVETTVGTVPSLTTRGGAVLLFGSESITYYASTLVTTTIVLRWKRDGVTIHTVTHSVSLTASHRHIIPVPMIRTTPAAGTYVFTLTAQSGSANLTIASPSTPGSEGSLFAVELA